MPVTTRISVALDITAEEAARQLEGGKPVEVKGGGNLTIIPHTNNRDTDKWYYEVYPQGDVSTKDVMFTNGNARCAVDWAVKIAGGE